MRMLLMIPVVAALPLAACSDYDSRPGYAHGGYHRAPGDYRMRDDDYIYRGRDGRYYCKRSDGTTGTIVGAIAGGVLGNIVAPGGSKTLGTVLGAMGGAVAGNIIDRDNIRCE